MALSRSGDGFTRTSNAAHYHACVHAAAMRAHCAQAHWGQLKGSKASSMVPSHEEAFDLCFGFGFFANSVSPAFGGSSPCSASVPILAAFFIIACFAAALARPRPLCFAACTPALMACFRSALAAASSAAAPASVALCVA